MPALLAERIDVTLPVRIAARERGRIHPISQVIDEITAIFADMGFSVAEGPDIETDYLQFHGVEFPARAIRPARCTTRSFFRPSERASARCCARIRRPVQIRTMEAQKPPIRIIMPGPDLPAGFSDRRTRRCSIRSKAW